MVDGGAEVRVGTLVYGGEVRNRPKSGQNHMAASVPYWRGERGENKNGIDR